MLGMNAVELMRQQAAQVQRSAEHAMLVREARSSRRRRGGGER